MQMTIIQNMVSIRNIISDIQRTTGTQRRERSHLVEAIKAHLSGGHVMGYDRVEKVWG